MRSKRSASAPKGSKGKRGSGRAARPAPRAPSAREAPARETPAARPGGDRRVTVELDELRARLAEAEETLGAIRSGEVDALVVWGERGEQVYTLQGAETPYRVLVEEMQEGALTVGRDGTVLYANRYFAGMTGVPLERVLGAPLAEFVAEASGATLDGLLREARRRPVRGELLLRSPDGAGRPAAISASELADDEAQRICVVITDLSEQKQRERQLAEQAGELARSQQALRLAERLASIGTLATGLGHDMSNMLMPIRMRLDHLESLDPRGTAREDIAAVRRCVDHLQALAAGLRLLALDPEQGGEEGSLDVAEWWPEAEPVLRTGFPRQIALVAEIAPGLPPLRIARHSLAQAVFNLVQNAGEALRPKGRGTVRFAAEAGGAADPDAVRLSVSDDGPGMTEEVRRRCLEPFFTTKTRRLSTGLGLALVHSIVTRAGGRIEVESQPGVGTTFTLVVPAALPTPEAAGPAPEERVACVSANTPRVRAYMASILEALGFRVVTPEREDEPGPARLWIAPATPGVLKAVRRFVRGDAERRAVLLGRAEGKVPAGVLVLSEAATPAEIHVALRAAAATEPAAAGPAGVVNGRACRERVQSA